MKYTAVHKENGVDEIYSCNNCGVVICTSFTPYSAVFNQHDWSTMPRKCVCGEQLIHEVVTLQPRIVATKHVDGGKNDE